MIGFVAWIAMIVNTEAIRSKHWKYENRKYLLVHQKKKSYLIVQSILGAIQHQHIRFRFMQKNLASLNEP